MGWRAADEYDREERAGSGPSPSGSAIRGGGSPPSGSAWRPRTRGCGGGTDEARARRLALATRDESLASHAPLERPIRAGRTASVQKSPPEFRPNSKKPRT